MTFLAIKKATDKPKNRIAIELKLSEIPLTALTKSVIILLGTVIFYVIV